MEEGCSTRSNAIEAGALAAKKTSVSAAAKRKDFVMLISILLSENGRYKRVDACKNSREAHRGRVDDRQ